MIAKTSKDSRKDDEQVKFKLTDQQHTQTDITGEFEMDWMNEKYGGFYFS